MGFLILFWTLFDGILQYVVPLVITSEGISKTMMGVIIGSSSLVGMLFDLLLCKIIKKPNLRRTYLIMFAVCTLFPLILMSAKTVWLYVLAMAIWGIYYDFFNVGRYEFVGQYIKEDEHASSFGVLQVFSSLGYLLSPLFAGFLIGKVLDVKPFIASWLFLGLAFISFMILLLLLLRQRKRNENYVSETLKEMNFSLKPKYSEIYIWKRVGILILPVLLVTLMISVFDAIFCEIGPLVAEGWVGLGILGSLFLVAYLLPFVFAGWFIGPITKKLGKKKTAIWSLLFSGLFLTPFFFITNPIILIVLTLFSGFFLAICDPANRATYADYVSETPEIETDIESEADFATNLGYVIGPILAGFLADVLGNIPAFAVIGVLGIILALILFTITPKEINITLDAPKIKNTVNLIKNKIN